MDRNAHRCAAALAALAFSLPAHAQVVLDGTLGPAGTLPGPNFAISDTLGRQVGPNLFHSFRTFNLSAGQSATFSGPAGTQHVISRVTGGAPSSIDGLVRSTIAGASVYLINPKGIAFGPNAQLDVGGAFHASSASHLKLGTSGRFDAVDPGASVLTVDAPSGFGFSGSPAAISADRSRLWVPPGAALSLSGGELSIRGRGIASGLPTLWAPGGRIDLQGTDIALQSAVVLTDRAGAAAGPVFIRGGKLTLEGSAISARNAAPGAGADIAIALEGGLEMHASLIRSSALAGGNAGDLRIRAGSLAMTGDSIIETSSVDLDAAAGGRAGSTRVEADGDVRLSEGSEITSISFFGPAAGEMRISARVLDLSGGASLNASTFGDGDAGRVFVDVEALRLSGGGHILAGSLFDSRVAPGFGAGGDIVVDASQTVDITGTGSGLFSVTNTFGPGGTIAVRAGTVRLADGGRISSASSDPLAFGNIGDAGSIRIEAARSIVLENDGAITTEALTAGGGIIEIRARDTLALADSRITTSVADGAGNGGDINIDPVFVVLNGSRIIAQAVGGNGGDITIVTQFLLMSPESVIDASSQFGLSGQVIVTAPEFDAGSRLGVLASGYVDPASRLRDTCGSRAGAGNSFVGAGRGGLPASPESAAYAGYGFRPGPPGLALAPRGACPS